MNVLLFLFILYINFSLISFSEYYADVQNAFIFSLLLLLLIKLYKIHNLYNYFSFNDFSVNSAHKIMSSFGTRVLLDLFSCLVVPCRTSKTRLSGSGKWRRLCPLCMEETNLILSPYHDFSCGMLQMYPLSVTVGFWILRFYSVLTKRCFIH